MNEKIPNGPKKYDLHEMSATNRNYPDYKGKITHEYGTMLRFLLHNGLFAAREILDCGAYLANKANNKAELDVQMLKELINGVELDQKTIEELKLAEKAKLKIVDEKAERELAVRKTMEGYIKIQDIRESNGGQYVYPKDNEK